MAQDFPRLVALLARLEDELPYVTVDALCGQWTPTEDASSCANLVAESIADQRFFTDRRQHVDASMGATRPVRLVRLNRRHPAVAPLLDD